MRRVNKVGVVGHLFATELEGKPVRWRLLLPLPLPGEGWDGGSAHGIGSFHRRRLMGFSICKFEISCRVTEHALLPPPPPSPGRGGSNTKPLRDKLRVRS